MTKSDQDNRQATQLNKTVVVAPSSISDKISEDIFTNSPGASISTSPESLIGKQLGRCDIEELLGKGGMGMVFKGHHTTLDIPVAVKILSPEFTNTEEYSQRFIREAQIAAAINHPSIVRVFDCGEEDGLLYIIQEFVEGGDLLMKLRAVHTLQDYELLNIGLSVAQGLQEAERHNIVHRDIKPQNIMVTHDYIYKLADLGIAKFHGIETDNTLTQSNACMGTPLYMSPEQAVDAKTSDIRSDIYSLGCTLFHLATGAPPYEGANWQETLSKHVLLPTPKLSETSASISSSVSSVIHKCMAKKPEARYTSAKELVDVFYTLKSQYDTRQTHPQSRSFTKVGVSSILPDSEVTNTEYLTPATIQASPDSCSYCGRIPVVSSSLKYQCTTEGCTNKICIDCWLRSGIRHCSTHHHD